MHLRFIHFFILILLMTILSGCVFPVTKTIHAYGRVLDSKDKRPISDAHVSIEEFPDATVLTAKDGTFDIPEHSEWTIILPIPEDRIPITTIIVNAPGYETQSVHMHSKIPPILLKRK